VSPDRAQELLAEARRQTEAELSRVRGGSEDEPDASTQADDLVERGTDEALQEMLTRRLEAIARAEARLRDGVYGLSVQSGAPIPDARLEIEPWAELTVEEQAAR
jgi:RNA polymerase-binding transcription factor